MIDILAKKEGLVLELKERNELGVTDQVAKKRRSRRVSSDTSREHESAAAGGPERGSGGLREDRVRVDVALTGQRIAA